MINSPATQVVDGCHVLGATDPGDPVWGHVSLRDADAGGVWIKAGPLGFDEISEDDVVLIDFDGNVLAGTHAVPLEYPLHTEILRARPEINSVVHAHPPYAIALSATGRQLRAFSNAAGPFVHGVPRYERAVGLIDTQELGIELARALDTAAVAFMVGHGIVSVGSGVATSVTTAILLERACRLQLLADDAGGISDSLIEPGGRYVHTESDRYLLRSWDYMLRGVKAAQADRRL